MCFIRSNYLMRPIRMNRNGRPGAMWKGAPPRDSLAALRES